MIYHLSKLLQEQVTFFNLFHYVSVRAICAFLSSILLMFLMGNWFIRTSQRKFRSKSREWTPETHRAKDNTPTMGGLFIIMIVIINSFLWQNLAVVNVWIFLLAIVGFGGIGFVDDYLKIKKNTGISARTKFLLQSLFATIVVTLWYIFSMPHSVLCVPFFKSVMPELGLWLIPWGALVMVATSNAVNLTDGLDGLATGPLIFSFATFSFIAYLASNTAFAAYLFIPYANSSEIAIMGATMVGVMLGFLWYNTYPAQIFMGDVGSLALGAGLALMALMARQELLLFITGGIFVLETASVIIQVASYKLLNRRMFKMAPIHHHFELKGWKEAKITVRFWIISIILSVLTILTLKIR